MISKVASEDLQGIKASKPDKVSKYVPLKELKRSLNLQHHQKAAMNQNIAQQEVANETIAQIEVQIAGMQKKIQGLQKSRKEFVQLNVVGKELVGSKGARIVRDHKEYITEVEISFTNLQIIANPQEPLGIKIDGVHVRRKGPLEDKKKCPFHLMKLVVMPATTGPARSLTNWELIMIN